MPELNSPTTMIRNIYSTLVLFAGLLLTLAACKVQSPASYSVQPPKSFTVNGLEDSVSAADTPWRKFFTDSTLTALIDTTLKRNPDLRMALERMNQSAAILKVSKGNLLPSLAVNVRAGQERFGDYTMNGVGNFDTNLSEDISRDQRIPTPTPDYLINVATTWEADVWGRLKKARKREQFRLLASQEGANLVKTMLVYQVTHHYYELLALDSELEIIRNSIRLQAEAVALIEAQHQAGKVTAVAVDQVKAQFFNTSSLEYQVLQAILEHENALRVLQGKFDGTISRGRDLDAQEIANRISPGLPRMVFARRPDVKQSMLQWQSHRANVGVARAAFYPTVSLSAFAGFNAFDTRFLFDAPASLVHGFFAGLTAPVFQRHQLKANYRFASSEEREAYLNYEKTVLVAFAEVVNELGKVDNFQQARSLKSQEVERLQNAVININQLFTAGYASYLEVITAQRNLLQAELDLAVLKRNQLQAIAGVYRAAGGGWD